MMKTIVLLLLLLGLSTAHPETYSLKTHLANYTMIVPEWEVEVFPGGPMVHLNGTIQEVRKELLKMNPNWDDDYALKPEDDSQRAAKSKKDSIADEDKNWEIYETTGFDIESYFCDGRWKAASVMAIRDGLKHLGKVKGRPRNQAGANNCGRVSCSWNSAIVWCNDAAETKTLGSFYSIVEGARAVADQCLNPKSMRVAGQAFNRRKWNVIIAKDTCGDGLGFE